MLTKIFVSYHIKNEETPITWNTVQDSSLLFDKLTRKDAHKGAEF